MTQVYEILQKVLNSPDTDDTQEDESILRDYLSEESIYAIECNIDFFKDLPSDQLSQIFKELLYLIIEYELDYSKLDPALKISLFSEIEDHTRPTLRIHRDIQLLQKYQNMLGRLFPLVATDKLKVIVNHTIDTEIMTIYNINKKLLNDLEEKKFNMIDKRRYYKEESATKTKIKTYLKTLRINYNLQGVSTFEKNLVDNLPSNLF